MELAQPHHHHPYIVDSPAVLIFTLSFHFIFLYYFCCCGAYFEIEEVYLRDMVRVSHVSFHTVPATVRYICIQYFIILCIWYDVNQIIRFSKQFHVNICFCRSFFSVFFFFAACLVSFLYAILFSRISSSHKHTHGHSDAITCVAAIVEKESKSNKYNDWYQTYWFRYVFGNKFIIHRWKKKKKIVLLLLHPLSVFVLFVRDTAKIANLYAKENCWNEKKRIDYK